MNGLHYNDVLAGRVFSQAASPLGLAIPIYTNTAAAGGMPIWNPPGSGVNVELMFVDVNFGSGTADFGAIGLMVGALASIGTATGCSAFAATQPVNALGGLASGGSKVLSSNAGTVTVTAGTATAAVGSVPGAGWARSLMSINLEANTATAHGTGMAHYDFKGSVIVTPGTLVYLACTKASVALYATTVVWKEMPVAA
jgi:hypothetical protein